MTTVKVRRTTRDSINEQARRAGKTADEYLAALVSEEVWRQRMARARSDMTRADSTYTAETEEWDSATSADGLGR